MTKRVCPVCGTDIILNEEDDFYSVNCPRCGFSSVGLLDSYEKAIDNFDALSALFNHVLKKLFYANVRAIEMPTLLFLLDATEKETRHKTFADSKKYKQLAELIREVIGRGENGR